MHHVPQDRLSSCDEYVRWKVRRMPPPTEQQPPLNPRCDHAPAVVHEAQRLSCWASSPSQARSSPRVNKRPVRAFLCQRRFLLLPDPELPPEGTLPKRRIQDSDALDVISHDSVVVVARPTDSILTKPPHHDDIPANGKLERNTVRVQERHISRPAEYLIHVGLAQRDVCNGIGHHAPGVAPPGRSGHAR